MLQTVSGGYLFSVAPGELDAEVFEKGVREGRRAFEAGETEHAVDRLREGLGLWRASPLAEVCFEDFAQGEIRRLEELRHSAFEALIDAELQLGRHAGVIAEVEEELASDPTREELVGRLMLALYRSGRQADALAVYQRTRLHLDEELGLEPGSALKALQVQILEQAPSLDRGAAGRAGDERRAPVLPSGTVTFLFTDVEGSTRLAHELGEQWGVVLAEHHRVLREVWAAGEGVEVDTEGDGFFVAFPYASSSVQAAAAAQSALAENRWPPGVALRVPEWSGARAARVHDGTYWGVDVHYAARLCSAAHGGQVLLSATTRALVPDAAVDDLGEHAVKDFPAARPLFHLIVDGRRAAEFPPPRTLEVTRTNLPSVATPLVGREPELLELEALLGDSQARLMTLVGLGGTGKTRLAVECGSRLLDTFSDGVFLAALAPVQTASGVAAVLAGAVAAPLQAELGAEAALLEHVRKRRMLLVVDNMEHVLEAAPLLARILREAPGVRILATSQAPLRLSAERVVALDALMVPPEDLSGPSELAAVPAVALFMQRARAADPTFALGQANATAVAELCRRLDGLPLALELAAARIRVGGAEALLAALERGLDALGTGARDLPDRHRGLRAALNWTVALLEDEQRMLFEGLAAFADAWTIEQVDALFGTELDTWNALAALIDFSLIRTRGDGRMTMVEHVRLYARELLAASGTRTRIPPPPRRAYGRDARGDRHGGRPGLSNLHGADTGRGGGG